MKQSTGILMVTTTFDARLRPSVRPHSSCLSNYNYFISLKYLKASDFYRLFYRRNL